MRRIRGSETVQRALMLLLPYSSSTQNYCEFVNVGEVETNRKLFRGLIRSLDEFFGQNQPHASVPIRKLQITQNIKDVDGKAKCRHRMTPRNPLPWENLTFMRCLSV